MNNTTDKAKLNALYNVQGIFHGVNQVDKEIFQVGKDYYAVMDWNEQHNHRIQCLAYPHNGYATFMFYWQYLGVDGTLAVYRLIQYKD